MDRRQILVVDDYAGARYLRSRILTDAGYEVVEAENGEDALRLRRLGTAGADPARRQPARHQRHRSLLRASGANRRQPPIPVIQITGAWLSEEARRRGMASGANAYLTEPVDDVTLLREVVTLLEMAPEKRG